MSKKTTDLYNKLYAEEETPFGEEPAELVRLLPKYLQNGNVLELGAGTGRNSLFLAGNGFSVLATDISNEALHSIQKNSKKNDLDISTQLFDMSESAIEEEYDVIVTTFTLHHLKNREARRVIDDIRIHTSEGGYNVISAFTKNGDFFELDPKTDHFYPDTNELKVLYKDWEILTYVEKYGLVHQTRPDGSRMQNKSAHLLAKKKRQV